MQFYETSFLQNEFEEKTRFAKIHVAFLSPKPMGKVTNLWK